MMSDTDKYFSLQVRLLFKIIMSDSCTKLEKGTVFCIRNGEGDSTICSIAMYYHHNSSAPYQHLMLSTQNGTAVIAVEEVWLPPG